MYYICWWRNSHVRIPSRRLASRRSGEDEHGSASATCEKSLQLRGWTFLRDCIVHCGLKSYIFKWPVLSVLPICQSVIKPWLSISSISSYIIRYSLLEMGEKFCSFCPYGPYIRPSFIVMSVNRFFQFLSQTLLLEIILKIKNFGPPVRKSYSDVVYWSYLMKSNAVAGRFREKIYIYMYFVTFCPLCSSLSTSAIPAQKSVYFDTEIGKIERWEGEQVDGIYHINWLPMRKSQVLIIAFLFYDDCNK